MKKNKISRKLKITIGILGSIAGIFLASNGDTFIGISGAIASGSIAFQGIKEMRNEKNWMFVILRKGIVPLIFLFE